jgi:hypothetical protein
MIDQEKKERLKKLKEERREYIERAKQMVKVNNAAITKIKKRLAQGSATVPELAEATGLPTWEALWLVSALKKYGQVIEGAKDRGDSYFPYQLAPEDNQSKEESAE